MYSARKFCVCFRSTLFLVLFAAAVTPAKSGTDAKVRSGAFDPYTVFSEGDAFPSRLKKGVVLLLHGFKSAMPNDDFDAINSMLGGEYTVIGFNYDYVDVDGNKKALAELFDRYLAGKNVVVLGTSLGGYWSEYLLNTRPVKGAVLVNPALRPQDVLRDNMGENFSERRQSAFMVKESDAKRYETHQWSTASIGERLVVLSMDDEVIAPNLAISRFTDEKKTEVAVFASGGHNIPLDRNDVTAKIVSFVKRVSPVNHDHAVVSSTTTDHKATVSWPEPSVVDEQGMLPGLFVEYYFAKFGNLRDLRPTAASRAGKVGAPLEVLNSVGNRGNVLTSSRSDFVGAKITGFIKIPKPGTYTFRFTTNDGFEIDLDGREIYSDPTVHKDRLSPELNTDFGKAGLYPLHMLYFEKKGTSTLRMEWRGPGKSEFTVVPASAFGHMASDG